MEQGTYGGRSLAASIATLAVHLGQVAKSFRSAVFSVAALLHPARELIEKKHALEPELANRVVETGRA